MHFYEVCVLVKFIVETIYAFIFSLLFIFIKKSLHTKCLADKWGLVRKGDKKGKGYDF